MAIQKIHRAKSTKPRSPILIILAFVACIAVLYLASSVVSTIGFSFSSPRSLKNLVKNPENHRIGHEKYLYWGNKIDCPGKHCESCQGLGHQESSLRCALEEALFLKRWFLGSTFAARVYQLCNMDGREEESPQQEMQKGREKIPNLVIDSTTNLLKEGIFLLIVVMQ